MPEPFSSLANILCTELEFVMTIIPALDSKSATVLKSTYSIDAHTSRGGISAIPQVLLATNDKVRNCACTCRVFHGAKIPRSVCLQRSYQICRAQSIFLEPGSMRIRLNHNEKALILDKSTIAATALIRSAKKPPRPRKKTFSL
jgi:hypothetical protein